MTVRIGSWTTLGLCLAAGILSVPDAAVGQTPAGPVRRPAVQHQQPQRRVTPQLQRRVAPPSQLPPGFPLTQQQVAELDGILNAWERASKAVKTFECNFTCWEYESATVRFADHGEIKYAAPDRAKFKVTHVQKNGNRVPIDPEIEPMRAKHWVCDGKSIFQFVHKAKDPANPNRSVKGILEEFPLPPDQRGTAIQNGPLPFIFGAEAARLKQRYFIRKIRPPVDEHGKPRQGETWLEAYPRWQRDAASFKRVELILRNSDAMPTGMHIYHPGGEQHAAYAFWSIVVNKRGRIFPGSDPFQVSTPPGWKRVVQKAPEQQAVRPPSAGPKR